MEKMSKSFSYSMPTKVLFGPGQLSRIGEEAKNLGNRALLVTGRTAMRRLGVIDKVKTYLKSNRIQADVFDQVMPNPTVEVVNKGGKLAKERSCDLIIGLGGGSVIDAAKGVAVIAAHGGNIERYIGVNKIPGSTLPVVAVPTTSGTGSEVTIFAVFTRGKEKVAAASDFISPKISILDPLLLISQSSQLTVCTGMDALAHAIEAYTSRKANFFSNMFAREAIKLIGRHLRRAVWVGEDLEARKEMALASNLAGMAINYAGTTAGHALGMSVGGFFGVDHGTTVGILLPHLMKYNISADLRKFAEISVLLGENIEGISLRDAALKSIQAVKNLMGDINLSQTLSEIGIKEDAIPEVVEDAMTKPAFKNNLKILTKEETCEMCRSAL